MRVVRMILERMGDQEPGRISPRSRLLRAPTEAGKRLEHLARSLVKAERGGKSPNKPRSWAPTDATVLVLGETGTGKELIARELHRRSRRKDKPLVRVNCACIPKELYESEFFGHARGAFTGAVKDRVGRFEAAAGGTLFLDEIGEIPLELQSKLLRVLQEKCYERVGEERTRRADVRIVAATDLPNRKDGFEATGLKYRDSSGWEEIIRHVFQISEMLNKQIKVAYLENYDMLLGQMITSGVDVWLNTPQPPLEASGTSGM
jgi:transcriptional regulator with AAA-type ATPase domain